VLPRPSPAPRSLSRLHALGVLGLIDLRVLDHDAIAGEVLAAEPTLEHDGGAGLEQLRRIALMVDRDRGVAAADVEVHLVAHLVHGARHHRALDPEALLAELGPLL